MNKNRIISVMLVIALAFSLCAFPASAEEAKTSEKDYPFIFVHGLLGYGDRAGVNNILPYWGMSTGDIPQYLNSLGYECYAATVGPITSAWDRACELYAQLTGTTVDYGIAHSAEKGHERFGITYDKPLFEGWSAEKKINLIGHSFGGATIRMFLDILADGCQEEIDAANELGVEVSPFFEGGKCDWVYSLTAISAPHSGTTFFEACELSSSLIPSLIYDFGSALGMTEYKGMYDLQLEHFGIYREEGETDMEFLSRVLTSEKFLSHNDNAMLDLTIDEALKINDGIEIQENVYYFSITGDTTHASGFSKDRIPNAETFVLAKPFSERMGSYYDAYTDGGFYIDETWLPNDALVNVQSALYPINSDLECVKKDGTQGYVFYDGESPKNFEKGVWNVLPVQPYDHISIVGGVFSNSISNTRTLYLDLIDNVVSTYSTEQTTPAFSYNNPILKFLDHTKWHQLIIMVYNMITWLRSMITV